MASKGQLTGMRGVYLVASELSKRGFIASPTSRSAAGADILATDGELRKAFSIQVKTAETKNVIHSWLMPERAKVVTSPSHFYVFVNIRNTKQSGEQYNFYVVPGKIVRRVWNPGKSGRWPTVNRAKIEQFKDQWTVIS